MIFLERKNKRGFTSIFEYTCVDVFGELKIKSFRALDAETLDMIAMKSLKDTPRGGIEGISWELNNSERWEEVRIIDEKKPTKKLNIKKLWAFLKTLVANK